MDRPSARPEARQGVTGRLYNKQWTLALDVSATTGRLYYSLSVKNRNFM